MKPHKHAELIKAWADGAEIQVSVDGYKGWHDYQNNENPSWKPEYHYRIKPEPKPDVIYETCVHWNVKMHCMNQVLFGDSNVKFTFNGETGKLKSAEVI